MPAITEAAGALGSKVREARQRLGVSQEKFAVICGISLTTLRSVETGRRTPQIVTLERIAEQAGLTVSDLLRADDAA